MEQNFFKKINLESIVIWSDCGLHFRSSACMYFFLKELPEMGYKIEVNFFGEKHGKSNCDQHFSTITTYLRYSSFIKKISCAKDIVDAIDFHQNLSNSNRENEKRLLKKSINQVKKTADLEPIIVHNLIFQHKKGPKITKIQKMYFGDFKTFYNFFTNDSKEICSRVLSDCSKSIKIIDIR
jgi:hypothetical protein